MTNPGSRATTVLAKLEMVTNLAESICTKEAPGSGRVTRKTQGWFRVCFAGDIITDENIDNNTDNDEERNRDNKSSPGDEQPATVDSIWLLG